MTLANKNNNYNNICLEIFGPSSALERGFQGSILQGSHYLLFRCYFYEKYEHKKYIQLLEYVFPLVIARS